MKRWERDATRSEEMTVGTFNEIERKNVMWSSPGSLNQMGWAGERITHKLETGWNTLRREGKYHTKVVLDEGWNVEASKDVELTSRGTLKSVGLVRVEPNLTLTAAKDGSSKTLLKLQTDHVCYEMRRIVENGQELIIVSRIDIRPSDRHGKSKVNGKG